MTDHREIHSPDMQRGMHVPTFRPACYAVDNPPWPCAAAETPDLWAALTAHTPGCEGCAKSRWAQDEYWGLLP